MPPVNHKDFATEKRIVARKYRNRRIGDFLKELDLTEGRGTGFPAIYRAMERNGSPKPTFETDDSNYVLVTLDIHPEFLKSDQATVEAKNLTINNINDLIELINSDTVEAKNQINGILNRKVFSEVPQVLLFLKDWKTKDEILEELNLSIHSFNKRKYIDPLVEYG